MEYVYLAYSKCFFPPPFPQSALSQNASSQQTDEQIDKWRLQTLEMIEKDIETVQSTGRGHSKPWRKDMQDIITKQILSTKKSKGEILSYVKKQLLAKWKDRTEPDEIKKIQKIAAKNLLDCVKSLTLKVLKILQAKPPKAIWYPDNAVDTLFRICRYKDLDSGFQALCNYLHRRGSQLKSISIPNPGIMFAIFLYGITARFARKINSYSSTFTRQST